MEKNGCVGVSVDETFFVEVFDDGGEKASVDNDVHDEEIPQLFKFTLFSFWLSPHHILFRKE